MRITYATESTPGHVNEDCAVCGNEWAVVLDGATAPDGVDSGCIHDVPWLVRHLAAGVTRRILPGLRAAARPAGRGDRGNPGRARIDVRPRQPGQPVLHDHHRARTGRRRSITSSSATRPS